MPKWSKWINDDLEEIVDDYETMEKIPKGKTKKPKKDTDKRSDEDD